MNLIHKEFLIAVANGEEVEFKKNCSADWFAVNCDYNLGLFDDTLIELRIKPKTVTLSMEIPMPFVPKFGEEYWYFNMSSYTSVYKTNNDGDSSDKRSIGRGVYRTEKEAEQALAAHEAAIAKLLEGAK